MPTVHKRLLVFITLSLCLHGIWFISQKSYRVTFPQQADSLMAVRLSKRPALRQDKPATEVRQDSQRPTEKGHPLSDMDTRDQEQQTQITSASVLSEIRQKLSHQFVYPVLARRMGWQGRVLLGFQLDASGAIHKVHIKQSSGHAILDNSAMATLNRIGSITVQKLGGFIGAWQLEIPVIYRLEG